MCETKQVKSSMLLDMNEHLIGPSYDTDMKNYTKMQHKYDKALLVNDPSMKGYLTDDTMMDYKYQLSDYEKMFEGTHDYHFVGKVGSFCPIAPGKGGGQLLRHSNDKFHAVTGTKGYRWLEADIVKASHMEKDIDQSYYHNLVDRAVKSISEYGDFEWFASEDAYTKDGHQILPF